MKNPITFPLGLVYCEPCGALTAITDEDLSTKLSCVCDPTPDRTILQEEPKSAIYCQRCLKRFVPGNELVRTHGMVKCPHADCGAVVDPGTAHRVPNVVHQCRCGGNYAIAFTHPQPPRIHHKKPPCKVFTEQKGGERFLDWVRTGAVDGIVPMNRRERRNVASNRKGRRQARRRKG